MDESLEVTEMADFVDYNSERAAQEAEEEEMLLWLDTDPWDLVESD